MSLDIVRGDARSLPLADNSVDLVVTSPPYFALRSYTDGGEHYEGQIGSEPTPAEFVAALLDVTRECIRVLKPSGSLWINLGDKYAGQGAASNSRSTSASTTAASCSSSLESPAAADSHAANAADASLRSDPGIGINPASFKQGARDGNRRSRPAPVNGIPGKSLMGLPWRYALACIDDLGLILRAEVIWAKPNGLPESVTDRVRRSHEQWFHFVQQPRYYSAVDEIREQYAPGTEARYASGYNKTGAEAYAAGGPTKNGVARHDQGGPSVTNPLGKLPGSVWSIPTEPLKVPAELGVDHFAAFPSEWPRRLILGWSPREVCTACGEGRRPVTAGSPMVWRESPTAAGRTAPGTSRKSASGTMLAAATRTITGYTCACPDTSALATPGVVLDPFGGTGTTAHVAHALGRTGISVDLSADYCRLAAHPDLAKTRAAKVLGVPKPAKETTGQADLFGEDTAA